MGSVDVLFDLNQSSCCIKRLRIPEDRGLCPKSVVTTMERNIHLHRQLISAALSIRGTNDDDLALFVSHYNEESEVERQVELALNACVYIHSICSLMAKRANCDAAGTRGEGCGGRR